MLNRILAATLCLTFIAPVTAGEYSFCLLTNKVAAAGNLKEYSDKQIENGVCMTTKEIVLAMVSSDAYKESICTKAAEFMMIEFKKRFPNRSVKSVAGKC